MADEQKREPVNPKWMLRKIMANLPKNQVVRQTVIALWAHCDQYLLKEDLDTNFIVFTGACSYSQLAEFMGCGESTAKNKMKHLKRCGVVTWVRLKYGIDFEVGCGTAGPGNGSENEIGNGLADSESEIGNLAPSSQVIQHPSQVIRHPEIGKGLPTLALSGGDGEKESGSISKSSSTTNPETMDSPVDRKAGSSDCPHGKPFTHFCVICDSIAKFLPQGVSV